MRTDDCVYVCASADPCVLQSLDVSYPFTEVFSCFPLKLPCTSLALKRGNLKEELDRWMGVWMELPITSNQNRMDLFAQGHTGGTLLNLWELVMLVELLQVKSKKKIPSYV
ncbi:hypothetical protein AMECASPLE_025255 [Ameca splendens]|uniref:Uncharacterized protein n=1 Tax=Ameca splendens TaxID=208324 RepID=A0ABV1AD30_9TELE